MKKIKYVHEPDDLQCGQAVLAMVLDRDVGEIASELGNFRETTLSEMKKALISGNFEVSEARKEAHTKDELPALCLLSLETPRCWHWSLYCDGIFYDPEHGILDDFPESKRRYYWELRKTVNSEK